MSDPMLTRLAERFAQLSPAQRRKFYQKLQDQNQSWAQFPIVPAPASAEGGAPLSYAQQRQWFLWQLDRESSAYHLSSALRWRGALDVPAMMRSFGLLADRHPQLKARFGVKPDGTVCQHVDEACTPNVEQADVHDLSAEARTARVQQLVQQWQQTPFDLQAGHLLRVGLIRLADDEHVLVVVVHHIVADDWSLQLLVQEFGQIYDAAVHGRQANLAPLPIQYTDYAAWQRSWMEAGESDRQLAYWTERLQGERPVLELLTDAPRRADGHYTVASQQRVIDGPLADGIRQLCAQERLTPFMVFLAAFQLLLARHTGLSDISVGIPVSNRNRPELEGLVGFFVNTQVLRTVMHEGLGLQQLLAQVRQTAIGAQAHQDMPFDQLVEALHPVRTPGVNPLFQVMFNYLTEDAAPQQAALPDAVLENYPLGTQGAQFELVMNVVEAPDGTFHAGLSWAEELFRAETIGRMLSHVGQILDAMVHHPDMPIGNVPLLSAAERAAMQAWACNPHQHASLDLVLASLARHVRTKPADTALLFGADSLSYEVLNRRTENLARTLRARGVRPEDRVGMFQERSLDLVVSMLGILKAGAAFVPLDPELPAQRIAYMMQDSGLQVVLTHEYLQAKLPAVAGVHAVLVEQALSGGAEAGGDAGTVYGQNGGSAAGGEESPLGSNGAGRRDNARVSAIGPNIDPNDLPDIHGSQLAYVIYTSGSTGTPKGVGVSHRSLASCMQWMQRVYALGEDDTVLHKAPIGFDVSCWEIFWPLTSGVRLAIAAPGDHRDPQRIFALIERHRVTTMNFVPQMLQAFLASRQGQPTGLKHVMVGGEAISTKVQSMAVQGLGEGVLQNLYGPTETTIHVTRWTCQDDGRTPVPIGRPIDETQAHVLDAALNPVPVGVPGELYIGGKLLARGYVNRPDLTAERFVADPFDGHGGRLYRTGDLVRWSEEGQLIYLGRIDEQVKVRGFRIELGEVEAQLLKQPGVREAVVVARETVQGTQLAGYVSGYSAAGTAATDETGTMNTAGTTKTTGAKSAVAYAAGVSDASREEPGQPLDGSALRQALKAVLPDYMVPSVIMVLDALPLNANGKIDRRALPEPVFDAGDAYEAPEGELETQLAQLWADVLGVERVGRNSNFFELGGHSLLALTLVERMRAAGIRAQVRELFEQPVLSAFADALAQAQAAALARAEAGEGVGEVAGEGAAYGEIAIPPNGIPEGCTHITPDMLPLVQLTQTEIDAIAQQTPDGMTNVQDIYPLAPLQEGMLFHHQLQQEGDAYVTPTLLAFDTRERLERFVGSLNEVVARHDILRTAVLWEGLSKPVQVVNRQAQVVLEWPGIDNAARADAAACPGVLAGAGALPNVSTDTSTSTDAHQNAGAAPNVDAVVTYDVRAQLENLIDPTRHRIDVRRAPMIRLLAAEDAANDRWLLQLASHHLISDHTTLERMVHEIGLLQQGRSSELPPIVPFRNFVAQAVLGADEAAHEAFFTDMLGDIEETTAPFGILDVMGDGSTVEEIHHPLPAALSARIRQVARAQGVSAASVFHLAWALVLSATSGQSSPVFGTVLFGRMGGVAGADQAMGMFINTLPVRIDVGRASAQAALKATHGRLAALLKHEHASLALSQRCSSVPAGAPLFATLLNYRYMAADSHADGQDQAWAGMSVLGGEERTNYPFDLSVDETGDGFVLVPQVDLRIGAARMAGTMQQAVEALVQRLEQGDTRPLAELSVLTWAEQQELALLGRGMRSGMRDSVTASYIDGMVAERKIAATGSAESGGLADTAGVAGTIDSVGGIKLDALPFAFRRFEAHAAESPDAVALVFEGQSLSYGKVNTRANRIAHALIAHGVGVDARVGIAVERSPEMIIGLLAIQKAGGVYVPLDPAYPADRLVHMMQDSGLRWVLTQAHLQNALPKVEGVALLDIAALEHHDGSGLSENPSVALSGDSLAYVIYTSGSTGMPKGVAISHAALAAHAEVSIGFFGLNESERMLQFSTMNFDGFVEQVFGPLSAGASIVIRGRDIWDSQTFHEHLLADGITVVDLTTAYWSLLVQDFAQRGVKDYGRLRQVHAGGEAMPPEVITAWRRAGMQHIRLLNTYGPTEATVTAVVQDCAPYVNGELLLPVQMPIGEALPGRQVHVLDGNLNPVPMGVAGELYIGGELLARGYVNRPELTAERFIANPFVDDFSQSQQIQGVEGQGTIHGIGSRLYRTGDIVRWNERGLLEYLGRIDDQIKVRGFRVELGEVEAQLLKQPGVREAVVVARDTSQGTQLAGYVSGYSAAGLGSTDAAGLPDAYREQQPGQQPDASALRQSLKAALPDYMVPAAITVLDRLPLNANGKIDRRALPAPVFDATEAYEAPQGELETQLAQLWADVLGVERVGRNSNFFELGGHSLLALTLVGRIKNSGLAVEASLARLLKTQTIAGYVAEDGHGYGSNRTSIEGLDRLAVSLNRCTVPNAAPLFMVHEGRGSVLDYVTLAQMLVDKCPVIGLSLDADHVPDDMMQIARLHARTIRKIQPTGAVRVAGWSLGGALAPLIAKVLEDERREVAWVGAIDPYIQSLDRENISLVSFTRGYVQSLVSEEKTELVLADPHVVAWLDEIRQKGEKGITHERVKMVTDYVRAYGRRDAPEDTQMEDREMQLGSHELSALFLTSWKLHNASNVPCEPVGIRAPMTIWWAGGASTERTGAFVSWAHSDKWGECVLAGEHRSIIRSERLIEISKFIK